MWEQCNGLGRKIKIVLLLIRTMYHKVGLAIITVGPSDMEEQLVQLFLGPNEWFWGWRTVGLLLGTFVTRTKPFWDPVSMDRNVRVELSLGPKAGGLNVKAPLIPINVQYSLPYKSYKKRGVLAILYFVKVLAFQVHPFCWFCCNLKYIYLWIWLFSPCRESQILKHRHFKVFLLIIT